MLSRDRDKDNDKDKDKDIDKRATDDGGRLCCLETETKTMIKIKT